MSKIWRDIVEPPSTDYIWYRLNEYNELVGKFEYKNSKWVLYKKKKEDSGEIDLSALINGASSDYDTLGELETAIKNISNDRTFKEFKSSWPTSTTLVAFCQAMMSDTDVKVGNAYLGGLSCSGLPTGMGQGDVVIDVIGTNNNKVLKLTLTSTDVSPYHWEGCYWQGSFNGWKSFELQSNKITSFSATPNDIHYPSEKLVKDSLDGKQPTIDNNHKLDYGLLSNTPTIPDAVEANPTVPAGTTPTDLQNLKVGSNYFVLSGKEDISNKVTSLSAQSTDTQYPSAKATYDAINPAVQSSQPAGGFAPNVVYDLGTLTGTVTFALAAVTDATIANAYHWTFDTGSTAPTIIWPSGIVWPDGFTPSVDASKYYEVLVRNGYASMLSYSLS